MLFRTVLIRMIYSAMIGTIIDGKYKLLRKIGSGVMGTVYEAEHLQLRRSVAIKILNSTDPSQIENQRRLIREGKNLAQLQSKNIVSIMSVGNLENGSPYLAMELVQGESLEATLAQKSQLSESETIELAIQLSGALETAHRLGIVHRDLKPANIMLTNTEPAVVKVLDFGLAKNLIGETSSSQKCTRTGALIGSVAYMAPELSQGQPASVQTDIYSLGCILYECIAGGLAFNSESLPNLLNLHKETMPLPLHARGSQVSPDFELIIFKCLQKESRNRFQSASELATILKELQQGRTVHIDKSKLSLSGSPKKNRQLSPVILILLPLLALPLVPIILNATAPKPLQETKIATHKLEGRSHFSKSAAAKLREIAHRKAAFMSNPNTNKQDLAQKGIEELKQYVSTTKERNLLFAAYQLLGLYQLNERLLVPAHSSFLEAESYAKLATGGKPSVESSLAQQGQLEVCYISGNRTLAETLGKDCLKLQEIAERGDLPSLGLDAVVHTEDLKIYHNTWYEICMRNSEISESLQKWEDALHFAEEAKSIDPSEISQPALQIADIYIAKGDRKSANSTIAKLKESINALAERRTANSVQAFSQGQSKPLFRVPDDRDAIAVLKSYKNLADWYVKRGDKEQAIRYYEQLLALANDSITFQKYRDIVEAKQSLEELKNDR